VESVSFSESVGSVERPDAWARPAQRRHTAARREANSATLTGRTFKGACMGDPFEQPGARRENH
jgi:hypothetical protein